MKLVIFDLDDTLFDTTGMSSCGISVDAITAFPGTLDLLTALKEKGIISALVSFGGLAFQEKKMEVLGIRNYFNDVLFCNLPENKLPLFKHLMQKYAIEDSREVVVVGDRIDREIMFGNMLGCITVQIRHGKHKGLKAGNATQVPKQTIDAIQEVIRFL